MSDFESTLNQLLSDPEQMEKLMGAAKAFMQPQGEQSGENDSSVQEGAFPFAGLDPKLLAIIGKLMGEYSSGNDKETLLRAISPYLKAERREQFKRATEMAKLARMARSAMSELGGT